MGGCWGKVWEGGGWEGAGGRCGREVAGRVLGEGVGGRWLGGVLWLGGEITYSYSVCTQKSTDRARSIFDCKSSSVGFVSTGLATIILVMTF